MAGRSHVSLEAVKTVLEVADVAWTAVECCHRKHHENRSDANEHSCSCVGVELEAVRSENSRLRGLLEENLTILQSLARSPSLLEDCPPDLYHRLTSAVDSKHFLSQLETLHQGTVDEKKIDFSFKEGTGFLIISEVLINIDLEEPSRWVWITSDMVPSNFEEWSGIDDDNYLVLSEEDVVDGVSNFIARCILANPKSLRLTPEELQKSVAKALHGVNKLEKIMSVWHAGMLFYTLSTWGLALTGLYGSRRVLKVAAKGIHNTGKAVLKAL